MLCPLWNRKPQESQWLSMIISCHRDAYDAYVCMHSGTIFEEAMITLFCGSVKEELASLNCLK